MKILDSTTLRLRRAMKGAFFALISASLVVVVTVAAVWPLWYLATVHTSLYTFLMLVAIVGGLAYAAYSKIRRNKADSAKSTIGS